MFMVTIKIYDVVEVV